MEHLLDEAELLASLYWRESARSSGAMARVRVSALFVWSRNKEMEGEEKHSGGGARRERGEGLGFCPPGAA